MIGSRPGSAGPGTHIRGREPQLPDADLLCLIVAQHLLQFDSETRWIRYDTTPLRDMFPTLLEQSGYNKRVRAAGALGVDTPEDRGAGSDPGNALTGPSPDPTRPQSRETTVRELRRHPPMDRIRLRHPERPPRPRTPRRTNPRRCLRPRRRKTPRPISRNLAQLTYRRTPKTLPHHPRRLRTNHLGDLHRALRAGSTLSFESGNPAVRAWEGWASNDRTTRETAHGTLVEWYEVGELAPGTVTLVAHNLFTETNETVTETRVLAFRDRSALEGQVSAASFDVKAVFGGWKRNPFTEEAPVMIFVAPARKPIALSTVTAMSAWSSVVARYSASVK